MLSKHLASGDFQSPEPPYFIFVENTDNTMVITKSRGLEEK